MKAVVVGAGLAGLSAGYRLKTQGWDVTVLEADAEIGGRTSSFHRNGYQLERGATQLSTGYQRYLELAREVGLADDIVPSGNKILLMRGGRLHAIDGTRPLTALFTGALGWRSKWLLLRTIRDYRRIDPPVDVLDVSASASVDGESALAYSERRLNRELYDVLIDPLIRTYVINRGDKVSVLEWFSALRNLAGQRMLALRGGVNRLPARLAQELDVRLSSPVACVEPVPGGVEVTLEAGDTIRADACVVATPLPRAHRMVPALRPATDMVAGQMTYNRAVVVSLGYARPTRTDAMGVLVPTVEHPQISLVWLDHHKYPGCAPAGHSLITCYFEESGLDAMPSGDDAAFIAMADAFVRRLFPELAGSRDMEAVIRWDAAIPNPAPGTYRAIARMKAALDPASPIQLAGDYFTCTGQNSAIHWGLNAAENIQRHIARRNIAEGADRTS